MSEESTQNLPPRSFEERVLTALSAINTELTAVRNEQSAIRREVAALGERMSALEEKVDRRLQETRPIWEGVQAQIRKLDTKFDIVIRELYEIRYDQVVLGKRIDELDKESSQ